MKTKLFYCFLLFPFSFLLVSAQVPQGFNYQAIARGSDGKEIANTTLQVKVSILSDTTGFFAGGTGTYIWEEQQTVKTNGLGLFTLTVGNTLATKVQGTAATFSAIDWKQQPLYIGTKINYSGWKNMGTSRLWTVPYAMVAGDLKNNSRVQVSGDANSTDSILFEVKNRTGQTVFAVYEEGVRIYVDDGTYKGKGKGGFAIGSFGAAKAPSQEYFRVTRDSTRIYTTPVAKGTKGGFAIGSFSPAKGLEGNYLNVTKENYFIGHQAGKATTTGLYNNFVGYEAGLANTTGGNNSFIGYQAGKANLTGSTNTFVGNRAGAGNESGSSNTFIGTLSGQGFVSGTGNTYLGVGSGGAFQNGNYNVFIGSLAGAGYQFPAGATGGSNNVAVGTGSGYSLNTGSNNVLLGNFAGAFNTTGNNNVFLGFQSGYSNSVGNYNLFLGFQSGYSNSSGNGNTYLGYKAGINSSTGSWNIAIGQEAGINVKGGSNIILGYQAGANGDLTGFENTFVGTQAGFNTTTGYRNIFIGVVSGSANIDGYQNVFLGNGTGNKNTSGSNNVFLGNFSGGANTTGVNNVFAGSSSGNKNTLGNSNIFLGNQAGFSNISGSNNILIGEKAGSQVTTTGSNTQMGYYSGYISTGASNTFLGAYSGYSLTTGDGNVFIGYGAGSMLTTASNRLYIENAMFNDNTTSLIYGEFDNDYLRLNANTDIVGRLGVGRTSPATRLDILGGNWNVTGSSEGDVRIGDANYRLKIGVATAGGGAGDVRINAMGGLNRINLGGNGVDVLAITNTYVYPLADNTIPLGLSGNRWSVVYSAGGVVTTSDIRMKSNVQDLEYGLESIMKLEPVSYTWKDGTDKNRRLGLIAQDVDKVITEVVDKGNDPGQTLGINYSELVPVLIKGMQEQQMEIERTAKENQQLKTDLNMLKEEVEKLKGLVSGVTLK